MGVKGRGANSIVNQSPIGKEVKQTLHNEIIQILGIWLKKHNRNAEVFNCSIVAKNLSTINMSGEIPDVIGWNYWSSTLIEVKTSRTDFLKDSKKSFRINMKTGMGNFRYYCCPTGLIKESELPEKWGLLYLNDKNKIDIIKVAEHQEADMNCERHLLLSIIRRTKDLKFL